jgi:hypothetical protein
MVISRLILLRMRNVSDRICRENQNTHFIFNSFLFRKSCRLSVNVEEYGRVRQATDDSMIARMRLACWISKATDTQNILIFNCFTTAKLVTRTRLGVKLDAH